MNTKIMKLKEAIEFAKNNGYIFAVYTKQNDKYILHDESYIDDIDENEEIEVEIDSARQINFNKFITVDKSCAFILHNNFNIPQIFPAKK